MGERAGRERLGVEGEVRVAEGVYARHGKDGRSSIRIVFMFRGIACREPLKLEATRPNIKYASNLRGEVLSAIERGTFDYFKHFPESDNARKFGYLVGGETVGNELRAWAAIVSKSLAPSTWLTYQRAMKRYLYPWFENIRIRDLTPPVIRARVMGVEGVTLKTARNILTPLQAMLTLAVGDGKIDSNPVSKIALDRYWPVDRRSTEWEPDPFAFNEMLAIFDACEGGPEGAEADYWRVAFGAGLRPSEQIEIGWHNVDQVNFRLRVDIARVTGPDGPAVKAPKTKAGKRDVELVDGAWSALQRQKARTYLAGAHVFLNPRTGLPWRTEETLRKRWVRILRKAGVRYRNPYQTRHTFISTMLSRGLPPLWVARQAGHETVEMLERHYGKWIDQGASDRRDLGAFFSHVSPKTRELVDVFPVRR